MVFVSVGDGCILAGVYKGFRDLLQMNLISAMPHIVGVQAEGSNALSRAMATGSFDAAPAFTLADSICVDVPRNGYHALALLQQFQGELATVTDEEIVRAQAHLSSSSGLFTEPAGAAAFAGFLKRLPRLERDATIVILATGNGLKDCVAAQRGIEMPVNLISSANDIL